MRFRDPTQNWIKERSRVSAEQEQTAASPADLGLESFSSAQGGPDEGLSLDKLKGALAAMFGAGDDPYAVPAEPSDDPLQPAVVVEEPAETGPLSGGD